MSASSSFLLQLVMHIIHLSAVFIEIKDPETPWVDFECFRLIEKTERRKQDAAHCYQNPLPDGMNDALSVSFEYLGNRADIQNLRRTSKRFTTIYDQYRIRQDARFHHFGLLFQNNSQRIKYRSLEGLLKSIPIYPDIYVSGYDIGRLYNLHQRSRRHVFRGLSTQWNTPFLSILLWNDLDWMMEPILLICFFGEKDMKNVVFRRDIRDGEDLASSNVVPEFGVNELNELLRRKRIRFANEENLEGLWGDRLWTMNRPFCNSYWEFRWFTPSNLRCLACICAVSFIIAIFSSIYWLTGLSTGF